MLQFRIETIFAVKTIYIKLFNINIGGKIKMTINHGDAVSLEFLVRNVYKVDRGAFGGLIDADNFENRPFDAAIIALAPLFQKNPKAVNKFMEEYQMVFDYPDEYSSYTFDMYYDALDKLINLLNS